MSQLRVDSTIDVVCWCGGIEDGAWTVVAASIGWSDDVETLYHWASAHLGGSVYLFWQSRRGTTHSIALAPHECDYRTGASQPAMQYRPVWGAVTDEQWPTHPQFYTSSANDARVAAYEHPRRLIDHAGVHVSTTTWFAMRFREVIAWLVARGVARSQAESVAVRCYGMRDAWVTRALSNGAPRVDASVAYFWTVERESELDWQSMVRTRGLQGWYWSGRAMYWLCPRDTPWQWTVVGEWVHWWEWLATWVAVARCHWWQRDGVVVEVWIHTQGGDALRLRRCAANEMRPFQRYYGVELASRCWCWWARDDLAPVWLAALPPASGYRYWFDADRDWQQTWRIQPRALAARQWSTSSADEAFRWQWAWVHGSVADRARWRACGYIEWRAASVLWHAAVRWVEAVRPAVNAAVTMISPAALTDPSPLIDRRERARWFADTADWPLEVPSRELGEFGWVGDDVSVFALRISATRGSVV